MFEVAVASALVSTDFITFQFPLPSEELVPLIVIVSSVDHTLPAASCNPTPFLLIASKITATAEELFALKSKSLSSCAVAEPSEMNNSKVSALGSPLSRFFLERGVPDLVCY